MPRFARKSARAELRSRRREPAARVALDHGDRSGDPSARGRPRPDFRRPALVLLALLFATPADAAFVDHEAATFEPIFEVSNDWMGAGAGFVDYDGDGWEDVAFLHATKGIYLYHDEGPPFFAFTDVTPGSGLEGDFENATGIGAADYDRDGDPDLFMPERRGLRLYRNDGDGMFTDVTADALPGLPWYGISVAFADVDADGWIDVYASSYTFYVDFPFHECAPSLLLRNRGDGTFESVGPAWGLDDSGCTLAVLASDYDRDGDPDLLAANDFGQFVRPNSLYQNDGLGPDGTPRLTDVSSVSGFDQRVYGMGLATADLDENGRADYFTTSFGRAVLLLGQEDGTFLDATEDWGVMGLHPNAAWRVTWGAAFLDVEMDGTWDLSVASGYIPAAPQIDDETDQPSLLWTNLRAGWAGNDATEEAARMGVAPPDSSRSVAIGDFDRDGDDDLATAAIGGFAHLYENDGDAGSVLRVHLTGTVSNPDAFGTLVTLRCGDLVRSREKFSGGAYASAQGPEIRVPLAGCEGGGALDVRWPSGLVESFAVDGSDAVLDLVEPDFLRVSPESLPADGASESVVRARPPEGAGHVVEMTTTAGSIGAVSDLGDGAYEARLRAAASVGDAALTVSIDGVAYAAHPRVRFLEGDQTTVHAFPAFSIAGTDTVVTIVPRDGDGNLDGPGRDVTVEADRGTPAGAVLDLGDGRYRATVRADGGGPLVVRALVSGVLRGRVSVPEIAGIDPGRTRVFAEPGYLDSELDFASERVGIVVSPRDGNGAIPPDFGEHAFLVLDASGKPMTLADESVRASAVVKWVSAADLRDSGPATVEIDGVPLPKPIELVVYDEPSELAAFVDASRSNAGPFLQTAYADGADTDWVAIQLFDDDGDVVPIGEWVSYETDRMTVETTSFGSGGTDGKAFLRAGEIPGEAWIDVAIDGEPFGLSTWIDLLPARDLDLDRIDVEVCVPRPWYEISRATDVELSIRPRWENDDLVGSNVPLEVTLDGKSLPVEYDEQGVYLGAIPVPDVPSRRTIHVAMPGTSKAVDLWVDFGEGDDPRNGLVPCVATDEPWSPPDAGPDGGDADADSDADADADGGDLDAGPDAARGRGVAQGGGCACRASGRGTGAAGAVVLVLVVRRRRRR